MIKAAKLDETPADVDVAWWWWQLQSFSISKSVRVGEQRTGFLGELATVHYEQERLGISELVEHVALENPALGFDVRSKKSIHGNEIRIEVKSSKLDFQQAEAYITWNEFQKLTNEPDDSYLYLWFNVTESSKNGPVIVKWDVVSSYLECLCAKDVRINGDVVLKFSTIKALSLGNGLSNPIDKK